MVVMRAGDVIPAVVAPKLPRKRKGLRKPRPPKKCPMCGTPTEKPAEGVFTYCPNRSGCPGQSFQHVKHFVSKGAMDIEGFGEKQAWRFQDEGLIGDVADIYDLDRGAAHRAGRLRRDLRAQPAGCRSRAPSRCPSTACSTRSGCPASAT